MEFVISYNKRIPKEEHTPQEGCSRYHFRKEIMKVIRGDAKNVVYSVKPGREDLANRIQKAARSYVLKNNLPVLVIKRRNHVFITRQPTAMEKKKALT